MSKKILIISSDYYDEVSSNLELGAINTLNDYKIEYDIIKAPGCFEIPFLIKKNIKNYDGFLALGCVIKGETYHFDVIVNVTSQKIMDISNDYLVPIGFGILTCYNYDQAVIRSDVNQKNKGKEAALACVELLK